MKSGSVMGALILVGVGGYFGYDWWKTEQDKKKAAKAAETAKNAPPVEREPSYNPMIVPNLKGMKVEQANEALAKAGFKNKVHVLEGYVCEYTHEKDMPPQHTICNQEPAADMKAQASRKIEVTVELDSYEEGAVGLASEWKRMPDVEGMTEAAALAKLKQHGFRDDEFAVEPMQGACDLGTVCETSPKGKERKVRARLGKIIVGSR